VCIVLFLAACGDDEPPGFSGPGSCRLQEVLAAGAVEHASEGEVRAALHDAAERLVAGTPEGSRAELKSALQSIPAGGRLAGAACDASRLAQQILASQSQDAGTAPDRAALLLTLDFAETYFALSR